MLQDSCSMATRGDQEEQTAVARQPDFPGLRCIATLEATHNLSIPATDANDQLAQPGFTCYVCNISGSADRLTTCLSASVHQYLTAYFNQQLLDPATLASDKLLQHLLRPGRAGTLARRTEGQALPETFPSMLPWQAEKGSP